MKKSMRKYSAEKEKIETILYAIMRKYLVKCSMPVFVLLTIIVLLGEKGLAKTGDYLSPISVVAGGDGKVLYVAEATAEEVAVFDIASGKVPR